MDAIYLSLSFCYFFFLHRPYQFGGYILVLYVCVSLTKVFSYIVIVNILKCIFLTLWVWKKFLIPFIINSFALFGFFHQYFTYLLAEVFAVLTESQPTPLRQCRTTMLSCMLAYEISCSEGKEEAEQLSELLFQAACKLRQTVWAVVSLSLSARLCFTLRKAGNIFSH